MTMIYSAVGFRPAHCYARARAPRSLLNHEFVNDFYC